MNKAERLNEILIWCMGCCDSIPDEQEKEDLRETKEKLLAIFMECVPEERNFMSDVCMWRDDADMIKQIRGEVAGHAKCRAETLRNIEELRK